MVDGAGSDRVPSSDSNDTHEGTALLAKQRAQSQSQHHMMSNLPENALTYQHYGRDEPNDQELDAHESELLLAHTVSSPPAASLAPEAPEGVMLQCRQSRANTVNVSETLLSPEEAESAPADLDIEAVPRLRAAEAERQYLINTNPRLFVVIFLSIMLSMFIAIFDGTIMASSHPVITSYFNASNSAAWLSTAFLLTSTAVQALLGRLSDDSMESLILARAVCGLGAGGMMSLGTIIISDLVPMERRGLYQSCVNVVFGLAAGSGAALGGLMADTLGWRWEFGVQVPAVLICLAATITMVPWDIGIQGRKETFIEAMTAFDTKGSILLTASTTFLILALNLGGNILPWNHPVVIASFAIVGVSFPSCLWAESKATRPIMPLILLHSSPRANIIFANFLGAVIWNTILFNVPLYFQAVLLTSATESGMRLIVPQVTGATIGTVTGILVTWNKRLKWPLVTGTALTVVGTAGLCSLARDWPTWAYLLALVPGAMGAGFLFPGAFLAVLATSEQEEQAVVSSTLVLWRALGSVLGVSCSSLVLQNSLLIYMGRYVVEDGHEAGWKDAVIERVRESVMEVAKLEDPVLEQVIQSYEAALRLTFFCCVGVALVSFCLVLPIRLARLGARI